VATNNWLVAFVVLAWNMAAIQASEERPRPTGSDVTGAQFFALALTNDQFQIALCRGRAIRPPVAEYKLISGESLLGSDFVKHGYSARYQFLHVIEPIKGHFDRLVVYEEGIKRGKLWPAFNSPSFIPPPDTQWIVVFREDRDGARIGFKDSEKKLPGLDLANRAYGVIRYDAANHLGLDAKEFLSDLKVLAQNAAGSDPSVLDQLKTEFGREIFAVMLDPAAWALQFDSYGLTLSAAAGKEEYRIGEKVAISVSIKNIGQQKRQLFTSPRTQSNYAAVLYASDGACVEKRKDAAELEPIGEPGWPFVLQRITTIDPGTVAKEAVDLERWFKADLKGVYRLVLVRRVGPSWDDGFLVSNLMEFSVVE